LVVLGFLPTTRYLLQRKEYLRHIVTEMKLKGNQAMASIKCPTGWAAGVTLISMS
jgi:hypothetical protein